MPFEEYLNKMRQEQNSKPDNSLVFSKYLETTIKEEINRRADAAYAEMREALAKQMIAEPQNRSYDYKFPHYVFLSTVNPIQTEMCKHGCRWDEEIAKKYGVQSSSTFDGYEVRLLEEAPNLNYRKGKYFDIFYSRLQQLSKNDGLCLSECRCQKYKGKNFGFYNAKGSVVGYQSLESSCSRTKEALFGSGSTNYIPVVTISFY